MNEWTVTHAFHAYMGGFALDSSGTDNPNLPPGHEQIRLTLKGVVVALRLRPELLQDFSVDAMTDESKASPLAKAHCLLPGCVVSCIMLEECSSIGAKKSLGGRSAPKASIFLVFDSI